jgi:CoA:oxalate CoA-transferase
MGWQVSNYLIGGIEPTRMGNENMTASPSGAFATGDGLLNIAANQQQQFETLCRIIGRSELATDQRFSRRAERLAHRRELKVEIEAALACRSARTWAALLNAEGVPSGEILTVPEILAHPQVTNSGLVKRFPDAPGVGREVAVVRSGFRLASGDPEPLTPPPEVGADTKLILQTLGLSEDEIAKLREEGAI